MSSITVTKTKKVPLKELTTHPRNPRKGNLELLRESLRLHGQYRPLVVTVGGVILAGNHTYRAMKAEGFKEALCSFVEVSEEEAMRILLMDNAANDQAAYDLARLEEALSSMPDLDGTGFGDRDLEKIRKQLAEADGKANRPEVEFTPELLESHNYIVLYFDNQLDWQTAVEKLGIKAHAALDSRPGYERIGTGRVIKGSPVIERLKDA